MTVNVGTLDRMIRAAIGIVWLGLAFGSGLALFDSAVVKGIAIGAGLVMLGVAATRVCPIYSIFGIKTCKVAE